MMGFFTFIGLLLSWAAVTMFIRFLCNRCVISGTKRIDYRQSVNHFSNLVRQHGGWDGLRENCILVDGVYIYNPSPPKPAVKPALLPSHEKNPHGLSRKA